MATEDLPEHLGGSPLESGEVPQDTVYYHNWLYSVVPVSGAPVFIGNDSGSGYRQELPLQAALVGYCKQCGRAFSKIVPTSQDYQEYPMDVQKEGCIGPS